MADDRCVFVTVCDDDVFYFPAVCMCVRVNVMVCRMAYGKKNVLLRTITIKCVIIIMHNSQMTKWNYDA